MSEPNGGAGDDVPTGRSAVLLALSIVVPIVVVVATSILVIVVAQSGASPTAAEPQPLETPPATADAEETAAPATPGAADAVGAATIPTCEQLRTPWITERIESGHFVEETRTDLTAIAGGLPGPVAAAAVTASPAGQQCVWANPASQNEASDSIIAVEQSDADWAALATSLTGAGWTPITIADATGFTHTWVEGQGYDTVHVSWIYAHVDGVWIIDGPVASTQQVTIAVEMVRSAAR